MSRTRLQIALLLGTLLFGAVHAARADGGRLQMRTQAGPFTVSLFTAPDTLAAGPVDASVLVQDTVSGEVLMDAAVTLTLTPSDEVATPMRDAKSMVVHLAHAQATNKLLQAAQVNLTDPGRWRADLEVEQGGRRAACSTQLEVAPRSSPRGTVWFFALLPLVVLLVFAGVQVRKGKIDKIRLAQAEACQTSQLAVGQVEGRENEKAGPSTPQADKAGLLRSG